MRNRKGKSFVFKPRPEGHDHAVVFGADLGLWAAGDVRFTTLVSLFTIIGVRLVLSVGLGVRMEMGVLGIVIAMCLEWSVHGILFILRQKSGKWKSFQVI